MSMHMHHPALSLNGKKKGKQKFANAAAKQLHHELAAEWDKKNAEWLKLSKPVSAVRKKIITKIAPASVVKHKSLNSWVTGPVSSKPSPVYTGTSVLGISTLHKSNAVPVFSQESAIDIARMRRG